MGADIHFVVERRITEYNGETGNQEPVVPARWVGVFSTGLTPLFEPRSGKEHETSPFGYYARGPAMERRNYLFFAALAGVRGEGPEPKGLPDDMSELAHTCVAGWGDDGHSHSCDTLRAFITLWLQATDPARGARALAEQIGGDPSPTLLGATGVDDIDLYRVIYWFDN